MTSRLTALATLFAIVAATTLSVAASTSQREPARRAAAAPLPVIVLPMVQVTGHRVR